MAQAHKRITRVNPRNLPSLKPRVPRCFFPSRESRSRSSRQDGIPTPHESPLIRSQIHGAIVHLDRPTRSASIACRASLLPPYSGPTGEPAPIGPKIIFLKI